MSRPVESGCSFAEAWRSHVDGLWVAHLVTYGPPGEIVRSRRLGKHETPAAALATIVVTLVLLHRAGRGTATPGACRR